MSVTQTDIKFYGSGANNLGGPKSAVEIPNAQLHALFDPVRAAEALTGRQDYRCIYVENTNTTGDSLESPRIWIQSQPANPGVTIAIGVGAADFSTAETPLPGGNENTAPGGVTFTAPADAANGLKFMQAAAPSGKPGTTGEGELAPTDYKPIWIERTVAPATVAMATDQFTLTVLGETV